MESNLFYFDKTISDVLSWGRSEAMTLQLFKKSLDGMFVMFTFEKWLGPSKVLMACMLNTLCYGISASLHYYLI